MTVKFEIKDQLAKLLATEDLVVEHKKVLTASFNVSTRVLVLPMWEKASNNVYDMLLSVSVAGAAGLFVATDVSLANNFLISYFGITENMSNLAGIGTAGLSTECGFTGIQLFQNTFLKKNWID